MPSDEPLRSSEVKDTSARHAKPAAPSKGKGASTFAIPAPLKRLFDKFPLVTYPPNELPRRSPRNRDQNVLYIFTTASEAAVGAPSFNPGCLKWQALLKFNNIPFRTTPSANHASPTGALPFLIPATPSNGQNPNPIPSTKLSTWLEPHHASTPPPPSTTATLRDTAYTSLLTRIRLAYLHALYLHPPTFTTLTTPLYINPTSNTRIVRTALSSPLSAAALDQLLSAAGGLGPIPSVDVAALYAQADEAFEALSIFLGDAAWFASVADEDGDGEEETNNNEEEQPGMLDASVFAYTHVILSLFREQDPESPAARLLRAVESRTNLVEHRDRILRQYFEENGV